MLTFSCACGIIDNSLSLKKVLRQFCGALLYQISWRVARKSMQTSQICGTAVELCSYSAVNGLLLLE